MAWALSCLTHWATAGETTDCFVSVDLAVIVWSRSLAVRLTVMSSWRLRVG